MPSSTINVYDRPTYQTEKVKGWDVVRMFKASALTSLPNSGDFDVLQGNGIISRFTQSVQSNYKGTNKIDLSKLENFDSIRLRMNGLVFDSGGWFNFDLKILDYTYTPIDEFRSNYTEELNMPNNFGNYYDWYLDIELTFFIDDSGTYTFVVNGNYTASYSSAVDERKNVFLAPFCGRLLMGSFPTQELYIDLFPYYGPSGSPYIIKSINLDFVE